MVEVLMTMLVLTVVLLGLAAMQVTSINQTTRGRRAGEALRLAQRYLEELQGRPEAPAVTGNQWLTMTRYDSAEGKSIELTNVGPDGIVVGPYRVERWVDDGGLANLRRMLIRVRWSDVQKNTEGTYHTREVVVGTARYQ